MKKEINPECCSGKKSLKKCCNYNSGSSNAIYGIAVIGALFYFLQNATSFGLVLIGIGKAIFWPAVLIFRIFTGLKM